MRREYGTKGERVKQPSSRRVRRNDFRKRKLQSERRKPSLGDAAGLKRKEDEQDHTHAETQFTEKSASKLLDHQHGNRFPEERNKREKEMPKHQGRKQKGEIES